MNIMTLLSDEKNKVNMCVDSCKKSVFDGDKLSEFKDWWSNTLATL